MAQIAPDKVQGWLEELRQAAIDAVANGDFSRAARLDNAIQLLEGWWEQDTTDEFPLDVATVLVTRAWENAVQGDYHQATAHLKAVIHHIPPGPLLQRAQEDLDRVQRLVAEHLRELIEHARQIAQAQPDNPAMQRMAWETVLDFQPNEARAEEALRAIEHRERVLQVRQRLSHLQIPLLAPRKDIREVEEARMELQRILDEDEELDSDLKDQLESIYEQIDSLRDQMLETAAEAVGAERNGSYEQAIELYQAALDKGFEVIVDNRTGEPTRTFDLLEQVRQQYWTEQLDRANEFYEEAQRYLAEGYPKRAVEKLEQAQDLASRVKEGGADLQQQLREALFHAGELVQQKQEAQELIAQAEKEGDPEKKHAQLVRARLIYSDYPGLADLLRANEELLLDQVIQQMTADLEAAREELAKTGSIEHEDQARQIFDLARLHCRTALGRGANLHITAPEWASKRHEAEELLAYIDEEELACYHFLIHLQRLDRAITEGDKQMVEMTLAGFSESQRREARVQHRLERLAFVQESP